MKVDNGIAMQDLTELEWAVYNRLLDNNEGGTDGWGSVYIDNCAFTKSELGALGSLEKKELYRQTDSNGAFGEVRT